MQKTHVAMSKLQYRTDIREVDESIAACNICIRAKARTIKVTVGRLSVPERKLQMTSIDIFGKGALSLHFTGKMTLGVVDRLSNFV